MASAVKVQVDDHDAGEDEWEYEYSTTERETYYLTLDLSIRDFLGRKEDLILHNNRGGYRVWYNSSFNDLGTAQKRAAAATGGDEAGGGHAVDEDGETGFSVPATPQQRQDSIGGTPRWKRLADVDESGTAQPEEIQILNLHSERPLVSYRGRAFQGSWASNIGTELLFASRDVNDPKPLPALRRLPDNVDLLGALNARLNFQQVDVPGAARNGDGVPQPDMDRYRRNGGVYIHVHSDKTGARRRQADFLEDLTVLKRARGEEDDVTVATAEGVYARSTPYTPRNDVEAVRARRARARMRYGARREQERAAEEARGSLPAEATRGNLPRMRRPVRRPSGPARGAIHAASGSPPVEAARGDTRGGTPRARRRVGRPMGSGRGANRVPRESAAGEARREETPRIRRPVGRPRGSGGSRGRPPGSGRDIRGASVSSEHGATPSRWEDLDAGEAAGPLAQ